MIVLSLFNRTFLPIITFPVSHLLISSWFQAHICCNWMKYLFWNEVMAMQDSLMFFDGRDKAWFGQGKKNEKACSLGAQEDWTGIWWNRPVNKNNGWERNQNRAILTSVSKDSMLDGLLLVNFFVLKKHEKNCSMTCRALRQNAEGWLREGGRKK